MAQSIKNRIFGSDVPNLLKKKIEARQKLSQKDKEILQDVWRDVAAIYAPATPEGTEEYEELHHKLKLIHRLMK